MGRFNPTTTMQNKTRVYNTIINSRPVPVTVYNISQKTGFSSSYVSKMLRSLIREGKIKRTKRGQRDYYYV